MAAGLPSAVVGALVSEFLASYPEDAARSVEKLPAEKIAQFLRSRPVAQCASTFERLTPAPAARALASLEPELSAELLRCLDSSHGAVLLARLSPETREKVLACAADGQRAELEEVMSYPPDSAGALMDPKVTTFLRDTTVDAALDRLRRMDAKNKHAVFLVDRDGKLVGSVAIVELAVAGGDTRLDVLADLSPACIQATAPRQEVVEQFEMTKLAVLPVVDFHGRLLGVVRHATLLEAAREEVSADIQAMVGASRDETALSSVSFAVRKRLPWLQVNLLTAFLAASVVGLFEDTIARFTALAVLLPVVAGQSGNTGAQALAVAMRGLALREIRPRHWPRLAMKEMSVAALNGAAVALTTSLAVFVWSRSLGLALVIGISMIVSMTAAGLAGAGIPMMLTALRQDPAQSSSIILTTVTDIVGFFSFLGIATALASMI